MTIGTAVAYIICAMIGYVSGSALWDALEKRRAAKASRARKDLDELESIPRLRYQTLKEKGIRVGSVVKFIAGGPNMLVTGICAGKCACRWFGQSGCFTQREDFDPFELEKVSAPSDPSDPSDGKQSKEA